MKQEALEKGMRTSAWLAYVVIVFEILYMISPFAFFYYSIYAVPLKILQASPLTSWLTTNILPHFTYQRSLFISILNLISWPLITIGSVLFLVGFVQVYWAKLRKTGSVSRGLYRYIRHPQYVALAITGLGATIYWSRFIVYLMYATMLFLYYYLARQEERICLQKFGDSYRAYSAKTGMFLPKILEGRLPKVPDFLPKKGMRRAAALVLIFCVYITGVAGLGFLMKDYALSMTNVSFRKDRGVIAVAPLTQDRIQSALAVILNTPECQDELKELESKKIMIYVLPAEWGIPELGIRRTGIKQNYLLHPETHGNSLDFNAGLLTVLFTEPILPSPNIMGKDMLKKALSFIPYVEFTVDVESEAVIGIKRRSDRGQWDGIPVPMY